MTRSLVAGGKGQKPVAEALDGPDDIGLDLHRPGSEDLLKPREMPQAKVAAVVRALEV